MTKNDALVKIAVMLMDKRIKPGLDKMIEYKQNHTKPIKYNPELDNNDYLEWKAKQAGKLTHLNK